MHGTFVTRQAKRGRGIAFLLGVAVGMVLSQLLGIQLLYIRHPKTTQCRPIKCASEDTDSNSNAGDISSDVVPLLSKSAELEPVRRFGTDTRDLSAQPRKILLDCGANVASTVQLFRETYPGGKDFLIHSFELDHRLAPYFVPYSNHVLHCPTAVTNKDGNMTAYTEVTWFPDRGLKHRRDMQWGGGSLFVSEKERKNNITGGTRLLSYRRTVPTIDLSRWIQENTRQEDYVIFKLDVEGAEFDILQKMLADGTFKWVDKYYGEFHFHQEVVGWTKKSKHDLIRRMKSNGIRQLAWAGEYRTYGDFEALHPPQIPKDTPGFPGGVYSGCSASPSQTPRLALLIQVGMNAKAARKLVTTIATHPGRIPVSLFVFGDFVELFPELVQGWARKFTVGMRENQPFPPGHFMLQRTELIRYSLMSAIERHHDAGLHPAYYLPESLTDTIIKVSKKRGLRLIQPTVRFPPSEGTLLTAENYYRYRDVERVPKAERILSQQLGETGGILSLDSDHPDSYMISIFLLDYLVQKSGYDLVSIEKCLAG